MNYIIPEHIQKLINEFEQNDINKIFNIGNTVIFYVKTGVDVHPIKLKIIESPIDLGNKPSANVFFAKNLSDYPIDIKGAYFKITHPNQDIRSGKFDVLLIGKEGVSGFIPAKGESRYSFKNIFKVDVRDDSNKLIDTYFANDYDKKNNINYNPKLIDFTNFLNDLETNSVVFFSLSDGSIIKLNYIDTKNEIIQFELNKNSKLSNNYKSLTDSSSIELSKNPEDIIIDKSGLISIKMIIFNQIDGKIIPNESRINNINDYGISDEENNDNEENNEISNTIKEPSKEASIMMKAILDDPIMKKAFYRQPSLWNIIMSTIKGENPRGTGIGPARDIIMKYGYSKIREKLGPQGDNFKKNEEATFEVLNNEIRIKSSGISTEDLVLTPNTKYIARVNDYRIGDDYVTLTNKSSSYKITILNPYQNIKDAFDVTITKIVKSKVNGISEYSKPGVIKFFNIRGSGYSTSEPIKNVIPEPQKSTQPNTTK